VDRFNLLHPHTDPSRGFAARDARVRGINVGVAVLDSHGAQFFTGA